MRLMLRLVCAGLLALALFTPAAASASPQPPKERRFEVHVTPEMLQHAHIRNVLYFTGQAYALLMLAFLLASHLSARLRDVAKRFGRWSFVVSMLYFALLSVATALLEFPLTFYSSYILPHQFALTHQGLGGWAGDYVKELLVSIVLGAPVAALAIWAIGRFRRWWLMLWIGSLPLTIIGVIIFPLFVDPLFNDFVPLRDPVLRQELLSQAARAGIEGGRVYQVDKSKQTTTMNAYVTGIGPSKRIVMWDTLLDKMDRDEVLSVMGHEMGHYVLHHLWKGLAFSVLISLIVTLVLQPSTESLLRRYGARWEIASAADPAALPAILFVVTLVTFLLSPAINGFSRWEEHQADQFSIDLTHLNAAFASAEVKLTEDSKADPRPNAFIEWWRYSHPSAQKRIDFALTYRRNEARP